VIFVSIALVVFAVVFCSAILGILLRRILPPTHLTDETKGVVILATGVVGTLTALVLGLLIAAANNSFNRVNNSHRSSYLIRRRLSRPPRSLGFRCDGLQGKKESGRLTYEKPHQGRPILTKTAH
jgi:hypothetical protein